MTEGCKYKLVAANGRRKLTDKRERFVREYLLDLNATAAYKRAGYKGSQNALEAHAARLVGNGRVQAAIQEALKTRNQRTEITTDLVVQETWKNYERCVEAGEFAAANKALELLGRHTGAFPNKHQHSGRDGGAIPITLVEFGRAAMQPD